MVVGDFLGIVSGEAEAETNPKVTLVFVDVELELLDGVIVVVELVVMGALVIVMVLLAETIVVELVNMAVLLAETIVVEFVNIGPVVVMVLFAEITVLEFVGEAEVIVGPDSDVALSLSVDGIHVRNEVKIVLPLVTVKLTVVAKPSREPVSVSVGAAVKVSIFREVGDGMGQVPPPSSRAIFKPAFRPRTSLHRWFPSA